MARRKEISSETKNVALAIQERLKSNGYIVHRLDDYLNRTIILKVDFGLLDTIRISEKADKYDYPYKYNVRMDLKKYRVEDEKKVRYFFPYNDYDKMFDIIDFNYTELKNKYGSKWYSDKLKDSDMSSLYGYGASYFWRKAYRV